MLDNTDTETMSAFRFEFIDFLVVSTSHNASGHAISRRKNLELYLEQGNRGTGQDGNRGTREQANGGTGEQGDRGTGEEGNGGKEEQGNRGTREQGNKRTGEQRTGEQGNKGTSERGNKKSQVKSEPNVTGVTSGHVGMNKNRH